MPRGRNPNRSHVPCRECGTVHQNPRSSSICPDCGQKLSQQRKAQKEQERLSNPVQDELDLCLTVEDLKAFISEHLI